MNNINLFNGDEINQKTILGHPSGLFTLFFYRNVGKVFILWNEGNLSVIPNLFNR